MKVALVTCQAYADLDADEHLLRDALRAENIDVDAVIWNDPHVDWSKYAISVVRNTWDYHYTLQDFIQWTERAGQSTQLWNLPPLLRWNTDKKYLKHFFDCGIPIVPTAWLERGSHRHSNQQPRLDTRLHKLMMMQHWDKAVVKPTVGAGGVNTWIVDRNDDANLQESQDKLDALLDERDMMLQPFLPSVSSFGEVSLLYIDEQFSHAVVKKPAAQNFLVQEMFGGTSTPFDGPEESLRKLQAFGARVLQDLGAPTLYARVDLLFGEKGEPFLSELEIVEPSLFFRQHPPAAVLLAKAIKKRLLAKK